MRTHIPAMDRKLWTISPTGLRRAPCVGDCGASTADGMPIDHAPSHSRHGTSTCRAHSSSPPGKSKTYYWFFHWNIYWSDNYDHRTLYVINRVSYIVYKTFSIIANCWLFSVRNFTINSGIQWPAERGPRQAITENRGNIACPDYSRRRTTSNQYLAEFGRSFPGNEGDFGI